MSKYSKLFELDALGNLPYFTHGVSKAVREQLSHVGNILVQEDEHAIYVKLKNGEGKLIVVETHLDHPGYVIDKSGQLVSVGSLYRSEMVGILDLDKPKPVSLYTQDGTYLSDGIAKDLKAVGSAIRGKVELAGDGKPVVNTQVLPRVKTGLFGDILKLRSVDNLATTHACLELIKLFSKKLSDTNITFVFSKLEEVFQIAATGIAIRGGTPFDTFDPNTFFIVLEAAPVCAGDVEDGPKLALAVTENGISLNPSSRNLAQEALVRVAGRLGVDLEMVDLKSHSDAISYQLVGGNSNVSCLLINSKNRHNIDEKGDFVAEVVHKRSIEQLMTLVQETVEDISKSDVAESATPRTLSELEKRKRKQLIKSYRWAQPRLKSEKLYPTNFTEFLVFGLSALLCRLD